MKSRACQFLYLLSSIVSASGQCANSPSLPCYISVSEYNSASFSARCYARLKLYQIPHKSALGSCVRERSNAARFPRWRGSGGGPFSLTGFHIFYFGRIRLPPPWLLAHNTNKGGTSGRGDNSPSLPCCVSKHG